ncbi:hypothetical protein OIDMADRAFT_136378 [Oidiodendron maius Zn]|uniref:Cytochrome P450 monooxygenase n=1 Tax=Oidiodendron maius (strain Zn) TaxID=913774 RepID=A0A0C3GV11_OIDMZ|nr:hypothetical protein OIDMADRAFT_136378 [Oidiodendron maius Zn]
MLRDILDFVEGFPRDVDLKKPVPYIVASIVVVATTLLLRGDPSAKVPWINPRGFFELTYARAKGEFNKNANRMVTNWFKKNPNKPVNIIADMGVITILPIEMTNEIRNDKRFNLAAIHENLFHSSLSGFEAFRVGDDISIVKDVIYRDLTKLLPKVTEPLAEESALALVDIFTDTPEWHDIHLKNSILRLLARTSSRVFLGTELCRNEEWLNVTRGYATNAFMAMEALRMWPKPLRPIANMFLKISQDNRDFTLEFNDAIDWFDRSYSENGIDGDPAMAQLMMSIAAIHTTSDLTTQTIIDIVKNPEIIEPLRKEIIEVLGADGWVKSSLHKMRLLDSVIKESQRLKPLNMLAMLRMSQSEVTMSDGTVIPKGCMIAVPSSWKMRDEKVHESPDQWDGYRFYRMREDPAKQHAAQLVGTGPEHLAFGHGLHACPGRFFVANEVKILLSHILIKYDLKFNEGVTPRVFEHSFVLSADPFVNLSIRRRQAEINI